MFVEINFFRDFFIVRDATFLNAINVTNDDLLHFFMISIFFYKYEIFFQYIYYYIFYIDENIIFLS